MSMEENQETNGRFENVSVSASESQEGKGQISMVAKGQINLASEGQINLISEGQINMVASKINMVASKINMVSEGNINMVAKGQIKMVSKGQNPNQPGCKRILRNKNFQIIFYTIM